MKSDPVRCAVRTSPPEGVPASASLDITGRILGGSVAGRGVAPPAVETRVATPPAAAVFKKLRRPRELGFDRAIRRFIREPVLIERHWSATPEENGGSFRLR